MYVLKKGNCYVALDENKLISKTTSVDMAKKFNSLPKAEEILNKATKKLDGFKVWNLEENTEVEEHSTKRRTFSKTERVLIYNRNKGKCAICGDFVPCDTFTVDHIIPLAKGGTNDLDNLQRSCEVCNRIKQDILPENLMEKLNQIILYQMKKGNNKKLYKKMKNLHKKMVDG